LDLRELLTVAAKQHGDNIKDLEGTVDTAFSYMVERFRAWYEEESIKVEVFMAVQAKNLTQPLDINNRVHAVNSFSQLPEAQALAAANKRVSNILGKLESVPSTQLNESLLQEDAEKTLAKSLQAVATEVKPLFAERDYSAALTKLATLRNDIDSFFDDVMVMADDEALRNNRIALLCVLRNLFLEVADISLLVPAK
ncbi:MAG: DALR anticodon-binding domain-containing protein, partial [Pseudomonadota bacterium]|nr:DALR anticodon-binding domain-containing protein [Pseudomonadota bacterium]